MHVAASENWARRRERAGSDRVGAGASDRARRVERLRQLAVLLDSSIEIPGTKVRIGVDPLLGLVPGVGDAVSTVMSLYIVYEATKIGATRGQIARMLANVLIDLGVGLVPVAGDVFDFAFKANVRNLRILGIDARGSGVRIDLGG